MKNRPQKLLIISPKTFFQYCQPAQNQPKSQFLFNWNYSTHDLCIMALVLRTCIMWLESNNDWQMICFYLCQKSCLTEDTYSKNIIHSFTYSEVPNKSVTFLIIFGIFSYLHGFLRTYTIIDFWENLPPTRLLGPHAY